MTDGLKVGLKMQIRPAYSDQDWYTTKVEDLTDTMVTIGAPLKGGEVVPISVGTTVDCQFPRDDAFYVFQAEVIQRRFQPLPLLVLRRPDSVQRFQRRQMFRLPAVLPVQYAVAGAAQKGSTVDISGGGFCLSAPQPLEVGTELEAQLSFPDGYVLKAKGRVVKATQVDGERGEKRYLHGIEFLGLPGSLQERIVAFIFAEQRERRRREVGPW